MTRNSLLNAMIDLTRAERDLDRAKAAVDTKGVKEATRRLCAARNTILSMGGRCD